MLSQQLGTALTYAEIVVFIFCAKPSSQIATEKQYLDPHSNGKTETKVLVGQK